MTPVIAATRRGPRRPPLGRQSSRCLKSQAGQQHRSRPGSTCSPAALAQAPVTGVVYGIKSGVRAATAGPPRASPTYSEPKRRLVLGDARRRSADSVWPCQMLRPCGTHLVTTLRLRKLSGGFSAGGTLTYARYRRSGTRHAVNGTNSARLFGTRLAEWRTGSQRRSSIRGRWAANEENAHPLLDVPAASARRLRRSRSPLPSRAAQRDRPSFQQAHRHDVVPRV